MVEHEICANANMRRGNVYYVSCVSDTVLLLVMQYIRSIIFLMRVSCKKWAILPFAEDCCQGFNINHFTKW
jgi:hypothetical protein